MKSYSPYDNVQPVDYPSIYVTADLNDPRVDVLGAGQWVAKLRATKTDHSALLLRTEMGRGHQGPSGRYDTWRDEPRVQSFMLSTLRPTVTEHLGAAVAQARGAGRAVSWAEWAEAKNAKTPTKGRWRTLADFDAIGPRGVLNDGRMLSDGRRVVSFASNDYLGSRHTQRCWRQHMTQSTNGGPAPGLRASLMGRDRSTATLEALLADWKSSESALVFPTGFAANLGLLSAIAGPQVLICSDELNHASIIDGCRLAKNLGALVEVYPHCDVDAVSKLLTSATGRAVVVTDAVFSMDGDRCTGQRTCAGMQPT